MADLKWKPGSGADAKARAKEMRKYAEQRSERRDAERSARKEKDPAPAALEAAAEGPPPERGICLFFQQGRCNKGAKCKFRHVEPEAKAEAEAQSVDFLEKLPAELWLQILSLLTISGACTMARTCKALAAVASTPKLWADLRERTFGPDAAGGATAADRGEGASERLECCRSEAALSGWRRAGAAPPAELPLAEMTSVALCGALGVSTHEGRMVRLWEVRSGRRLACSTLKTSAAPLCVDARSVGTAEYGGPTAHAYATVGDSSGALRVFDLEGDFGAGERRPFTPRAVQGSSEALCSVVMLRHPALADEAAAGGGGGGGAGGGGAGGGGGEGDEENDGGDEDEDDDEPAAPAPSSGVPFSAACAYRDGHVLMTTYEPDGGRGIAWEGRLSYDEDDALTYGPLAQGGGPALVGFMGAGGLVSLADGGGDGTLYAAVGHMACSIDAASGTRRWASGRGTGLASAEEEEEGGLVDAMAAAALGETAAARHASVGARLASYSPGWGLLAVASRGVVALWDPRTAGGPAGVIASSWAGAAAEGGCVHLDGGWDGWGGHLMHLPARGAPIEIYDVRRVAGMARSGAADGHAHSSPLLASLAPAPLGRCGGCFAADAGWLVASGGGAKAPCSFRWASRRAREGGRDGGATAAGGDDGEEAAPPAPTPPTKKPGKQRQAGGGGGQKNKQVKFGGGGRLGGGGKR